MKTLLLLLLLLPIGFAHAHMTGNSYEQIVGEGKYKVDIGYDPNQLVAGERAILDFNIRKMPGLEQVQFDDVWVRIVHDNDTLLATGVARMPFGPTTLLYVIPESVQGDLKLKMRFEKGDKTIVEMDFSLPVAPARKPSVAYIPTLSVLFIGVLMGAVGILFARKFTGK